MTSPVDTSALPAEVRAAGDQGRRLYEAALGFESVLLSKLASGLTDSVTGVQDGSDGGDGESGGDAATALTGQLVPDALAQSVAGTGGTGLALELYRALRGPAA